MVIGVEQPCWNRSSFPTRSSPFNSGITSTYSLAGDPFKQSTPPPAMSPSSSSWNSGGGGGGDYLSSGTLDDAFSALNLGNGFYEQRRDIAASAAVSTGMSNRSFRQQPPPPLSAVAAASGGFGFNVGQYSSSLSDPLDSVLFNQKISDFDGSRIVLNEQLIMLQQMQQQQQQLNQQMNTPRVGGRSSDHHLPLLSHHSYNHHNPFLPRDESSSSASSSSSSYYDPQNLISSPYYGYGSSGESLMSMRVDGGTASYWPSGFVSNYTNHHHHHNHHIQPVVRQQERQLSYLRAKSAARIQSLSQSSYNNTTTTTTTGGTGQRRTTSQGWQRGGGVSNQNQNPGDSIRIADLRGIMGNWAKDSDKCKLLQDKLKDESTREDVEMVLEELLDCVPELMKHDIGNYLVQKLIEISDVGQRTRILLSLTNTRLQLLTVCFNSHGTRAVQKLLENLTTEHQKTSFMSAITQCAVSLAKDMNGHHVIQHCLKNFSPNENMFLLHEIAQNCYEVGTDKSGCCVLQQCIEYSQGESRNHLLSEVVANSLTLSENRYGNYVVQFALGLRDPVVTGNIIKHLSGSFVMLACNKFASNVVEKCLKETERNDYEAVIWELISGHDATKLLLDPYGNFVIQSALEVSEGTIHNTLLGLIEMNLPSMRSNMYGRKVIAWLNKQGFALV